MSQRDKIASAAVFLLFLAALVRPFDGSIRGQCVWLFEAAIFLAVAGYLFFRVNRWVAGFLVLAFISRHFPMHVNPDSVNASRWVLMGAVWYAIFYENQRLELFLDALCIVAAANAVVILLQATLPFELFLYTAKVKEGVPGLMANPNETAAIFAMCAPAFLRKRRWPWLLLVVASWIPARSVMAAMVSLAAGSVYALVQVGAAKKTVLVLCVGCILLAGLYATFVKMPSWRFRTEFPVVLAQKTTPAAWVMGIGIGNWPRFYKSTAERGILPMGRIRMHNTFLQTWFEMGLLSLVVMFGYAWGLARRISPKQWMFGMVLISILICANVNSMFRMNAATAMVAIAWLAVMDRSAQWDI